MDLMDEIVSGEHDEELDEIVQAVNIRRRLLDAKKRFKVGDRVVINARCKPKYIQGYGGKITGRNGSSYTIDLGERVGRYGPIIHAPASIIDKEGK